MKNLKTIFGAIIIASFMLTSCSQKPTEIKLSATEIKLSDLDTACDYMDAMEKCMDAIIEIKGDKRSISELTEEKQEYARRLEKKIREIDNAGSKKFTEADAKECKNYEGVIKKMKVVETLSIRNSG